MLTFLHSVRGHHKGLEWMLTNGDERFHFTSNFIHPFVVPIDNYDLEAREQWMTYLTQVLESSGKEFSLEPDSVNPYGGKGSIHIEMERADFEQIRNYLDSIRPDPGSSESLLGRLQSNFSEVARWEFPRYQKMELSPSLADLLTQQIELNDQLSSYKHLLIQSGQVLSSTQEQVLAQAEQAYERGGIEAVTELFTQNFVDGETSARLTKKPREKLQARLDLLARNRPSHKLVEQLEHRQMALGVIAKAHQVQSTHQASILARRFIKKPQSADDSATQNRAEQLREHRDSLEQRLERAGHELTYRSDDDVFLSHLRIASRSQGRTMLAGITPLSDERGRKVMMRPEDFLKLNKAYYDIEKPQFDTWMETISWCATLAENKGDILRVLDTTRPLPWDKIKGYTVVKHRFEHELVRQMGRQVGDAYLHFIFNITYEASQTREEGSFEAAGKKPRKRATADPSVDRRNDFMARWEMSRWGEGIDWMRFSRIAKPHRPVHRLESYTNHQAARAGLAPVFEKIIDYETMRKADQWAALLGHPRIAKHEELAKEQAGVLADYGVSDVEVMFQNMQLQPTIDDFVDVVDIAQTFGVSLSQVTNNANTVRELFERRFFEIHGYHNDQGHFQELHRKDIQRFKNKYTSIKITTFKESGMDIEFRKGLHHGVDQYYFSPELAISELIRPIYPEVSDFVDRTMALEEAERVVGRLQYLRSFVIPILSDHNEIRHRSKTTIQDAVAEIGLRAMRKQDDSSPDEELLRALEPFGSYFARQDRARTDVPELKRIINQFLTRYEQGEFPGTPMIETWVKPLRSWRNRAAFFPRMHGVQPQELEDKIFEIYESAVRTIDNHGAEVLQLEGKFIYIAGQIDEQAARQVGMIRIQSGMSILNMGRNDLTYQNDGFYRGKSSKRPVATHNASLFEKELEHRTLDSIFEEDLPGVLRTVASKARELQALGRSGHDYGQLLRHVRSRGVYKGFVQGEEDLVEISELERPSFEPDIPRYQSELGLKLFGATEKGVTMKGKIPRIIHTVIPLTKYRPVKKGRGDQAKSSEDLYLELIRTNSEPRQEEIVDELSQGYRLRQGDQGKLF